MRNFIAVAVLWLACTVAAAAQVQTMPVETSGVPIEILRSHTDIEVGKDGSFVQADDVAYRALNEQGVHALQQMTFSYTDGYQDIVVESAYTLKANGTRIDVTSQGMLYGRGASSAPGFEDSKTLTVVFPNLEVGDQVVLALLFKQAVPWFSGQFSAQFDFTRAVVAHDIQVDLTAPLDYPLKIEATGVDATDTITASGKHHWTWRFHNDPALKPDPDAVAESDDGPHVAVSSFADYAALAHLYTGLIGTRAAVTPAIQALADQLTAGISDRREQARALYEWVSTHITYVNIVLGAGGFIPHESDAILNMRYGDCKDHVMLLKSLLAAKKIESSAVLIDAGRAYRLPTAPSLNAFDHMITYVPEFHLFLDSTARYAPFGTLPWEESGKPVVIINTGEVPKTPVISASDTAVHVTSTLRFADDGSASGDAQVSATGAAAVDLRGLMSTISANGDADYLRATMGPGADGTLARGNVADLSPTYSYSVHYRLVSAANFPGPGAILAGHGYRPFYITALVAGDLPSSRMRAYSCISISMDETQTISLPDDITIMSIPKDADFDESGIKLQMNYTQMGKNQVRERLVVHIDHPDAVCTADYYNRIRKPLASMVSALRAQILYK